MCVQDAPLELEVCVMGGGESKSLKQMSCLPIVLYIRATSIVHYLFSHSHSHSHSFALGSQLYLSLPYVLLNSTVELPTNKE